MFVETVLFKKIQSSTSPDNPVQYKTLLLLILLLMKSQATIIPLFPDH